MRISKKDKAEYNRLKKNVKAKIKRVQEKEGLDLSGLIELPPLDSFTRKDFNLWKEKAKKFSSRINKVKHNEHGVPYTNQMVQEYQKRAEKANQVRKEFNEKFANLPYLSGGKETRLTVGLKNMLMKNPDVVGNLTEYTFNIHEFIDLRGVERRMKRIDKYQTLENYRSDLEEMRENWIEVVKENLNSDGDDLIKKVMSLSPEMFYELYQSIEEMSFEYIYKESDDGSINSRDVATFLEQSIDKQLQTNHLDLLKDFPNK